MFRQTLHHTVDPRQSLDRCNTSCMQRGGQCNKLFLEGKWLYFSPPGESLTAGTDIWARRVGYPLLDIALRYT
jgi:hypothetical protein